MSVNFTIFEADDFMLRHLTTTFLLGLLSACGSAIPEQNQDPSKNNAATFHKDLTECKENYPEQGSGVHIRQWQGCMNLKGWK